jgi:hypothetical protein
VLFALGSSLFLGLFHLWQSVLFKELLQVGNLHLATVNDRLSTGLLGNNEDSWSFFNLDSSEEILLFCLDFSKRKPIFELNRERLEDGRSSFLVSYKNDFADILIKFEITAFSLKAENSIPFLPLSPIFFTNLSVITAMTAFAIGPALRSPW